jgi:CRP-like cAMP-binding protein
MTFYDAIGAPHRHELDALLVERHHADGDVLFTQGDPATGAHLVRSGAVVLSLTLPGGAERHVATLGPGEFFGEPALLQPRTRQLTARALGATRVDFLDRHDFQGLHHCHRPASFAILLEIARLIGRRIQGADAATRDRVVPCLGPAPMLGVGRDAPGAFDPRPYLPRLEFFARLSPGDHEALLELGTLWELPRGRVLLHAGQRSDRCFVVIRGAVEAIHGSNQRVALFGPGTAVGQLAPLLGTPVLTECRMREPGTLLELGPSALAVLLQPESPRSFRFVNALCLGLLGDLDRANRVLAREQLSG